MTRARTAWAVVPLAWLVRAVHAGAAVGYSDSRVQRLVSPLSFRGDRREVASERIQRSRAGITPPRVAIALRGPRGVCGGVNVKKVGCCTHILPPGSEATCAVNMCKAWVTFAAAAAQRSFEVRTKDLQSASCI